MPNYKACINRDYAETLATAVHKSFGTCLPEFNPEKVPLFVAKSSRG